MYPAPRPRVKWSATIGAGFKSSHGSSYLEDTTVDWNFRLRTKKHRFRQGGRFVVERSENSEGKTFTTEENLTAFANYSYFFTENFLVT